MFVKLVISSAIKIKNKFSPQQIRSFALLSATATAASQATVHTEAAF